LGNLKGEKKRNLPLDSQRILPQNISLPLGRGKVRVGVNQKIIFLPLISSREGGIFLESKLKILRLIDVRTDGS
jgi:hypothetical protein